MASDGLRQQHQLFGTFSLPQVALAHMRDIMASDGLTQQHQL